MKQTLNKYEVVRLLLADENASWTRAAAWALADYYENFETETETEIEFDRVAIRCDWTEYETLSAIAEDYRIDVSGMDEADAERTIRRYLEKQTEVIELPDAAGFLVRAF